MNRFLSLLIISVLALCAPSILAQNLVVNGGFEAGDFSGWTPVGNFEFSTVNSGPFYVYSGAQEGAYYATFGPVGMRGGITQSFDDVAGQPVQFTFWLAAVGDDPSFANITWDGNVVYAMSDPNTGGTWTEYSFTETATGHDSITFNFRDDPGYIALDNISVVQNQQTAPEPSSLMLLGSGVLAAAGVIRRRTCG